MKWSYSAHRIMRLCQRRFVFAQVVAAPNANDPTRREAHILKQLQELSSWQGSVVHRVLATDFLADLRAGRRPSAADLASAAHRLMDRQLAFSAARRYREAGQTKSKAGDAYCALFEHERGHSIPNETVEIVRADITRCFEHLIGHREFVASLRAGTAHLAEPRLSYRFDGSAVCAQPDLVFLRDDGLTIVDWKIATSETSNYAMQLLVYALVVANCGRWPNVTGQQIHLYEANLLRNEIRRHPIDALLLEEAEDFVFRSLAERRALIGDAKFDGLEWDDFDLTEHPAVCAHCGFAPLCIAQLAAAGQIADAEVIQGRLW